MISVDIPSLIPEAVAGLLEAGFEEMILEDLAAAARNKWMNLANSNLRSSREDYKNSISEITGGDGYREISLVGWLANAVEKGIDPFDLRDTLLHGPKGGWKTAANGGHYRAIPFRHGTPGTSGTQVGAPMGHRYGPQGPSSRAYGSEGQMSSQAAQAMGKSIYKQALALTGERGNKRLPYATSYDMGAGKKKTTVQTPLLAPWHKTDIYGGMQRDRKTYGSATQSQYVTFRTISDNNPDGWLHPGIEARHLASQVETYVQELVPKVVQKVISEAIRGIGQGNG